YPKKLFACVTLITLLSVTLLTFAETPATKPATTKPAVTDEKEPWISKPPAQWPLICLTNDLLLKDKRNMTGASVGLVQLEDGRLVAATARHLLGDEGG